MFGSLQPFEQLDKEYPFKLTASSEALYISKYLLLLEPSAYSEKNKFSLSGHSYIQLPSSSVAVGS